MLGHGLQLLASSLGFCILSVGVADFNGRRSQLKLYYLWICGNKELGIQCLKL